MKVDVTTKISDPRLMAWDTEFWGVRVGKAEHLDDVSAWAVDNNVGLMCVLVDTIAEVQQACEQGFMLTDVRVTLKRTTARVGFGSRPAVATDLTALEEIAEVSFRGGTRFYNDPGLPNVRCDDLYRAWIRSQLAGAADIVLVAEREQHVAGFVSVDLLQGDSDLSLIAVAPSERGGGVGEELVSSALNFAHRQERPSMNVVTQASNLPAQRLFQRCGFRTCRTQYWLHRRYL